MQYKNEKKLDDKFNPAEIETRAIRFWEENQVYAFDKTATRDNTFVVDTPPPTVSGSLHIGHIFSYRRVSIRLSIELQSVSNPVHRKVGIIYF